MAGFLYFVPKGKRGLRPAEVPGLAHAFEGARPGGGGFVSHEVTGAGPSGGPGLVIADARFPSERLGYYPQRQVWRRLPSMPPEERQQVGSVLKNEPANAGPEPRTPHPELYVGFDREVPPHPGELARSRILPGHLVRLADDQPWLVPVAIQQGTNADGELRRFNALPTAARLDDDGRWVPGEPLARYERLWEIATTWWDRLMTGLRDQLPAAESTEAADRENKGADAPPEEVRLRFEFAQLCESACEILAVNYRLGPAEVSLLGLLDEQGAQQILEAVVDWPTVLDWVQKKTTAGASSPAAT